MGSKNEDGSRDKSRFSEFAGNGFLPLDNSKTVQSEALLPNEFKDLELNLGRPRRYWVVTLSILLYGMVFNGTTNGFASPALVLMQSNQSGDDLVLTDQELSWVSSLAGLGYPVGTILSGVLMRYLGRKWATLTLHCSSYVFGFGLIYLAPNANWIFLGRFVCGICQGSCNCIIIVYTLEMCINQKQRALVGVLLAVMGYSGTLFINVLGVFLTWRQLALTSLVMAVPFVVGLIIWVPEAPQYHLSKGQSSLALNVYDQLFGIHFRPSVQYFLNQGSQMSEDLEAESFQGAQKCQSSLKLLQALIFMLFYQFAGYNVICFYAASILQTDAKYINYQSNRSFWHSLDPALVAAVFVALAGLLGVVFGVYLVQHFQRKNLLITTGYGSIGFPMLAEMLPPAMRPIGMSFLTTMGGIFTFANAKSFSDLSGVWGQGLTFIVYGAINFLGAIYIRVCVPKL
eukprot:TCALIF_01514-PA protein Name:"Similar to Tret1-2 Facilitated trehalose transporter Tret1-2 homolog (Drosophila simulans)" AED:0.07 eAED:0.07 QI:479/0.8/0.66/1/1/1/6/173/456